VISYQQALRVMASQLAHAHIMEPLLESRLILQHYLNVSLEEWVAIDTHNMILSAEQYAAYKTLIMERVQHKPLAYITGYKEFFGRRFAVSPASLIPRPESELIIELALSLFKEQPFASPILDIGTGTGCLLLSLLAQWPNSYGHGIEINHDAILLATYNSQNLQLADSCQWIEADIYNWQPTCSYPLILSNPPYIPAGDISGLEVDVRDFEPHRALNGGADGLEMYRYFAKVLPIWLMDNGYAILECGANQAHLIASLYNEIGLKICGIYPDLQSIDRCIVVQKQ
jgi:release factor glutamine methyltransferase